MYDAANNVGVEEAREAQHGIRMVNHTFLTNVYAWFSAEVKERDGYGIYKTPVGRFIEGTATTVVMKNPYPPELKGEFAGCDTSLERVVLSEWSKRDSDALPEGLSIDPMGSLCGFSSLSSFLFKQLEWLTKTDCLPLEKED